MATLDRRGRPLTSLRLSVTDRCNLRCHYCMPEAGVRLAAEGRHPRLRGDHAAGARVCLGWRHASPAHRRRAPAASRSARAGGTAVRGSALGRPGADDQRHSAGARGGPIEGGRAATDHGEPRHARPRTIQGVDAVRRTAASPRGSRARRARVSRLQDRHRRHARCQRGRDRVAGARGRAARGRDPFHRVHGCRRRHAVDGRPGLLTS